MQGYCNEPRARTTFGTGEQLPPGGTSDREPSAAVSPPPLGLVKLQTEQAAAAGDRNGRPVEVA